MNAPAVPVAAPAPHRLRETFRGPVLACLCAVAVLMLDTSMLTAALPAITRDLRLPAIQQAFVLSGYSLFLGCSLLAAAYLGDRFGRGRVYLAGMSGSVVFALAGAAAGNGIELLVARGAQGLCAALVAAQSLAIIDTATGPRGRATAFAAHSATGAIAATVGPVLGGFVVDAGSAGGAWRPVFLVEAFAGAVAVVVILRVLPPARPATRPPSDIPGVALCALAVGALLGCSLPPVWSRYPVAAVVAGSCVSVLAVAVLLRRRRRARTVSVLPVGLLGRPGFAVGALSVLGCAAIITAVPLTVSTTVQLGLGYTAVQAGALLMPSAVGAVLGAITAPMLLRRWGNASLTAGASAFAISLALAALLIDPGSGRLEPVALVVPLAAAGIGFGWFVAPLPALLMAGAGSAETGAASGLVPTLQQLGGALGPMVLLGLLGGAAARGEQAAAPEHLAACVTTLWTVVGAAAVLAAATLVLPRGR
ncbi:MFS transporter [Nocardia sp. NPDC003963]